MLQIETKESQMKYLIGVFLGLWMVGQSAVAGTGQEQQQQVQQQVQQTQQQEMAVCTPQVPGDCEVDAGSIITDDEHEHHHHHHMMWRCSARSEHHENHWGGHVARGRDYDDTYRDAMHECRQFHHHCEVHCHRIHE